MKRPASYNTKQREAVLKYIVSRASAHVTAAEIVKHFANAEISVGRTTVYRHLDKLIEEGKLCKYSVYGITGACYRYIENSSGYREQLLLKCEDCGELSHMDCHAIEEINRHIYNEHTFAVNTAKTVFYGKCEVCNHDH